MYGPEVHKYIKKWELDSLEPIAETDTAKIFLANTRHGKAVLKVFNEKSAVGEASAGSAFLQNMQSKSCAKLYEFNCSMHLVEYLPGSNLCEFSRDNLEELASNEFIRIIEDIQSLKDIQYKNKLKPLEDLCQIFQRVEYPVSLYQHMSKAQDLAESLLRSQKREVLLHGDLHHANVRKNKYGKYVCFDPKGIYGDPAYELGATLKNPWDYPEISEKKEMFHRRAEVFSKALSIPFDRIFGFAYVHLCMSVLWAIEDSVSFAHQERLLRNLGVD